MTALLLLALLGGHPAGPPAQTVASFTTASPVRAVLSALNGAAADLGLAVEAASEEGLFWRSLPSPVSVSLGLTIGGVKSRTVQLRASFQLQPGDSVRVLLTGVVDQVGGDQFAQGVHPITSKDRDLWRLVEALQASTRRQLGEGGAQ